MAREMERPDEIEIQKNGLKLKVDGKGILNFTIRALFDLLKPVPVPTLSAATLVELNKAVQLKRDKESLAFLLIVRSLVQGVRNQLQEELDSTTIDEDKMLVTKDRQLQAETFRQLSDAEHRFRCEHLRNPHTLPLLQDYVLYYRSWLQEVFAFPLSRAEHVAADFKYYFGFAFCQELQKEEYADLSKWCNHPALAAELRLRRIQQYQAELRTYYNGPSLGQKDIPLASVYIEPNFLVFDQQYQEEDLYALREKNGRRETDHFVAPDYPYGLHDYIRRSFLGKDASAKLKLKKENSRMLLLLGQPGHGKSSFCYRTMVDITQSAELDCQVQFFRLRDFTSAIINQPKDQLQKRLDGVHKIDLSTLWEEDKKSLLLLDGLDELCMTEGLNESQVRTFLTNCENLLRNHPQLHIIISSRFNYIPTGALGGYEALIFSLAELNPVQQNQLLSKFKKAKEADSKIPYSLKISEEELKGIHEDNRHALYELIQLPILLQMILISEVELSDTDSRSQIYDELFTKVLEREWSASGRLQKYVTENFSPKDLRAFLSFLALQLYQSKRGYLSRKEIESYDETKRFADRFLVYKMQDVSEVLKDILTSFYLKERRKDPDDQRDVMGASQYSVEFLHKSLYEYLSMEYVWNSVQNVFLEKDGSARYVIDSDVHNALPKILGHTRLTDVSLSHLYEIVDHHSKHHNTLQIEMAKKLEDFLKDGFLRRYPPEYPTVHKQSYTADQQALHLFHGYWAILGRLRYTEIIQLPASEDWLATVTPHLAQIDFEDCIDCFQREKKQEQENLPVWLSQEVEKAVQNKLEKEPALFEAWLRGSLTDDSKTFSTNSNWEAYVSRYLFRQLNDAIIGPIWQLIDTDDRSRITAFIRYLRLLVAERLPTGLMIQIAPLAKTEQVGSLLANVNYQGSSLSHADLSHADLSHADLRNADLSHADLSFAKLSFAKLSFAKLSHAKLSHADLSNANLSNANLRNANLSNADLSNAFLWNADLRNADLSNADLRNANLRNAFLSNAYLSNAFLSNAYLSNAYLSNANLSNAFLSNAYLSNANLSNAYLSNAYLSNANLSNAFLSNANLSNADLSAAIVHSPDWLSICGAQDLSTLQKRYRVDPEEKTFERVYGEVKGYVIVKIGEEEE